MAGRIFKFLCVAAYAVIVAGITWCVHARVGPHTVAVRSIERNQLITDGDLRSVDQAQISGRYARRPFKPGDRITPGEASRTQIPLPENVIAGVIAMPRPWLEGVLGAESSVQVCLDQKPLGKPTKVLASACDRAGCVVTVPLPEWPKDEAIGMGAARLSAVIAGEQCGSGGGAGGAGYGSGP